jgi:hypothetical protein
MGSTGSSAARDLCLGADVPTPEEAEGRQLRKWSARQCCPGLPAQVRSCTEVFHSLPGKL